MDQGLGLCDIQLLLASRLVNRWWSGEGFSLFPHVFPPFLPFFPVPFTLLRENCSPGFKTAGFTSGTLSGKPLKNDGRKLEDHFLFWEGNGFFVGRPFGICVGCKRQRCFQSPFVSAFSSFFAQGWRYPVSPQTKSGKTFHFIELPTVSFWLECDVEPPRNDLFGELASSDGVLVKKRHVTPKGQKTKSGLYYAVF